MVLSALCASLSSVFSGIVANLHPVFYPFIPYWTIILVALCISPLTVLLPNLLKKELSWPVDVPDVWTIHGKRYNLKAWASEHPGGSVAIRSAKGSDCTGLFESCHTFIDRSVLLKMLNRFELIDGVEASPPAMVYSNPFYEDLKQMARDHFKGQPKGAHKMTVFHLSLCFSMVAVYWYLIYQMLMTNAYWVILPTGCVSWYLTGNMMHDGSHNALVSSPRWNWVMSHAAFPFGVNVTAWRIQHVMTHHIYTNEHDHDVDLHHFDPVISMKAGVNSINIVLHYLRLIYIMSTSIAHLVLVVPYGLLFGQTDPAHGHKMYDQCHSILAHRAELRWEMVGEVIAQIGFWATCAYFQGAMAALCFNMSIFTVSSYCFAFFTQVSHLQEECFFDPNDEKLSFAERQVKSSKDFSADSAFWGHISGGLNTQAIHHCLPSISAMHLREMYPKFRQVCKAHGVEVKEADSLRAFVMGFISFAN